MELLETTELPFQLNSWIILNLVNLYLSDRITFLQYIGKIWRKRDVYVMSTIHDNGVTEIQCKREDKVAKPNRILSYNKYMRGVDKCDQHLNYYFIGWKSLRWWERAFFQLVQLSAVNAMVTYFHHKNDFRKKKCFHKTFRQMLVHELVQSHLDNKANPNLVTSITRG